MFGGHQRRGRRHMRAQRGFDDDDYMDWQMQMVERMEKRIEMKYEKKFSQLMKRSKSRSKSPTKSGKKKKKKKKKRKRKKRKVNSDTDSDSSGGSDSSTQERLNELSKLVPQNVIRKKPRKWPINIIIDSVWDIAQGKDETQTNYYKLCKLTRKIDGTNKYFKTVFTYLMHRRYKFSKVDYLGDTDLGTFVTEVEKLHKKHLTLNVLVQSGCNKLGFGSSKKLSIKKDDAIALLRSDLQSHLKGLESANNEDDDNDGK